MSNEVHILCRLEVYHRQCPQQWDGLQRQHAFGFGEFDRRVEPIQREKRHHELPNSEIPDNGISSRCVFLSMAWPQDLGKSSIVQHARRDIFWCFSTNYGEVPGKLALYVQIQPALGFRNQGGEEVSNGQESMICCHFECGSEVCFCLDREWPYPQVLKQHCGQCLDIRCDMQASCNKVGLNGCTKLRKYAFFFEAVKLDQLFIIQGKTVYCFDELNTFQCVHFCFGA